MTGIEPAYPAWEVDSASEGPFVDAQVDRPTAITKAVRRGICVRLAYLRRLMPGWVRFGCAPGTDGVRARCSGENLLKRAIDPTLTQGALTKYRALQLC